jgi:hypothetical protein
MAHGDEVALRRRLKELYAAVLAEPGEPVDCALADRILARAAKMKEAELPQLLTAQLALLDSLGYPYSDPESIAALDFLRAHPDGMRLFIAESQEKLSKSTLMQAVKRAAAEKTMQQVALLDEVSELTGLLARLGSMPDEQVPPRKKNERHGGTRRKYDRAILRWLDSFQPDGWETRHLLSAYKDVTGIEPPRSWIQRHKKKLRK